MQGQLGTLSQGGRQVGGFMEWSLEHSLILAPSSTQWRSYKLGSWKARGNRPWLFEKPESDVFDVTFYNFIRGKLVENHRDRVKALLPNSYPLNEHIEFVLEMRHCEGDK